MADQTNALGKLNITGGRSPSQRGEERLQDRVGARAAISRAAVLAILVVAVTAGSVGVVKFWPPQSNILPKSVAVVAPAFTTAPYALSTLSSMQPGFAGDGGFYTFYHSHQGERFVSSDLNWLRLNITTLSRTGGWNGGWGQDDALLKGVTANYTGVTLLTDIDVDGGGLFTGGAPKFGTVYLGHEEYVTQRMYGEYRKFVADGGRLVLMYGDEFEVEVSYSGGVETLVAGHGWRFDGNAAVADPVRPFQEGNANWVGSSYWQSSLSLGLFHSEDDELLNRTATAVLRLWYTSGDVTVAYYTHSYREGSVTCYCRSWPPKATPGNGTETGV